MSEDNALIQALLSQIMPEWSIGEQAYQPTDIANQTSGTNILQDQFQLMANPLMQILNGTFDYSLLDDVEGKSEVPETPMLNSYAGNEKYAAVIQGLQNGESPEEAARGAWAQANGIAGDAVWATKATEDPVLSNYLDVAKSVQPDIAAVRQYQSTGGNGMVQSDMAKQLEAMGLSSEQTPDSYFSDSIERELADEEKTISSTDKIIDDYLAERSKFGKGVTNPYADAVDGVQDVAAEPEVVAEQPTPNTPNRDEYAIANSPMGRAATGAWQGSEPYRDVAWNVFGPGLLEGDGKWWDDMVGAAEDKLDEPKYAYNGQPGHDAVMDALRERDGQMSRTPPIANTSGYTVGDRGSGAGDPRDPRSQTSQAIKWDEDKAKREGGEDIMKYVNAKQGRVHGNSSAIERGLIDRERSSGRTMQRDALTRLLLSMPR